MRTLLLASGLIAAVAESSVALAQQPAPPKSPWTATANINLVSDYRFRGITQTWRNPAVQGGADVSHDNGFFAGTWASNVSGNEYPGGNLEWDFYGGWNFKLSDDVTIPVGAIYYWYPGANFNNTACPSAADVGAVSPCGPDVTPNNFELNAGFTWKWLSFKVSVALTDYFGADKKLGFTGGTSGTQYYDLSANYPINDNLTSTRTTATRTSRRGGLLGPRSSGLVSGGGGAPWGGTPWGNGSSPMGTASQVSAVKPTQGIGMGGGTGGGSGSSQPVYAQGSMYQGQPAMNAHAARLSGMDRNAVNQLMATAGGKEGNVAALYNALRDSGNLAVNDYMHENYGGELGKRQFSNRWNEAQYTQLPVWDPETGTFESKNQRIARTLGWSHDTEGNPVLPRPGAAPGAAPCRATARLEDGTDRTGECACR